MKLFFCQIPCWYGFVSPKTTLRDTNCCHTFLKNLSSIINFTPSAVGWGLALKLGFGSWLRKVQVELNSELRLLPHIYPQIIDIYTQDIRPELFFKELLCYYLMKWKSGLSIRCWSLFYSPAPLNLAFIFSVCHSWTLLYAYIFRSMFKNGAIKTEPLLPT